MLQCAHPGQAGPWLLPKSLPRDDKPPKRTLPRVRPAGTRWVEYERHEQEWLRACKTGTSTSSRFEIAGALTELALLGNVAVLSGKPIAWDRAAFEITNAPAARQWPRRP